MTAGCSTSSALKKSYRGNLGKKSKTSEGIFVIVIVAITTTMRNSGSIYKLTPPSIVCFVQWGFCYTL